MTPRARLRVPVRAPQAACVPMISHSRTHFLDLWQLSRRRFLTDLRLLKAVQLVASQGAGPIMDKGVSSYQF